MAKNRDSRLKLPDHFLGTVRALLQTPPPNVKKRPKRATAKKGR
jgi:hypothetical protein